MFPSPRLVVTAALAASAFGLSGCSAASLIPNARGPEVAPPSAPVSPQTEPATPEPTRTARPSDSRPSTTQPPTTRPSASTRPTTSSSYNPTPTDDQLENGYVPRASVEMRLQEAIKQKSGASFAYVSCPGNLLAKSGEKMTCTVKRVGDEQMNRPIVITVTSVSGNSVRYSIEVR